ncbi:uncharacterized protein AC631_01386 [Debaryomyces fabryi]|uniref:Uncharacterized protein n=1 Tax=Debaryomyces fabryi TaxID=58627 RepID=A0A0V1Q3I8_9ASCO|nr:uncharacterized protein AC631_01386 [Debaryomyces fabryi]KSA02906.1 hypothetical protein AC631_01386 [Debaryomyces fabryi]CUM45019.1 unnamed protein product [Debaryomyces fabryi]
MHVENLSSSKSDDMESIPFSRSPSSNSTGTTSKSSTDNKFYTLIIIGLRGVGKSSLALMALAALKYKYVDVEKCVLEYTGMPEARFLETVTVEEYRELQFKLVLSALKEHENSNLIVVLPSTVIDSHLLMNYLAHKEYPYIINVETEESRILNYLNFNGSYDKGVKLIQLKFLKYRAIAKYNFFNLNSDLLFIKENLISIGSNNTYSNNDSNSYLLLKPIEKEFIRFLNFILKGSYSAATISGNLHLKMNFLERFTSCLQISFPNSINEGFLDSLHETIYGSDAIEIQFDLIQVIKLNISASNVKIDEFVAQVRRYTYCSIPIILSISNSLSQLNLFIDEYSISSGNDYDQIRGDLRSFYFNILYSGIKTGLDYLIVDLSMCFNDKDNFISNESKFEDIISILKELVIISGQTEIIGSFSSDDPNFWISQYGAIKVVELAKTIGIKFLRLTSPANELSDNFKVMFFKQNLRLMYPNLDMEVIAFNTGKLGKLSKLMNKTLTPVSIKKGLITSSDLESDGGSSLSSFDIQRALNSSFITPSLDFYVMGINVTKSLSPEMHNSAYRALGLPHCFKIFECSSLIPNLTNLVNSPTFGGTAIIMPFKMEALKYVDTMSNHVKIIGALNTIIAERSIENPNKIINIRGENTDWLGVKLTLQDNISPINAISKNKTALVIGAGGMSRAAIYALIQLGYQKILLYNRTYEKAQLLANYYNSLSPIRSSIALSIGETSSNDDLNYFEINLLNDDEYLNAKIPDNFDYPSVVISCVPSSDPLTGKLTNFELSLEWFKSPSGGVVLETGYDPLVTPLLKNTSQFSSKGWVGINGLNYLYAQVLAQFEMFTNKPAPKALLKDVVIKHYQMKKCES